MTVSIRESLLNTKKALNTHQIYPRQRGIYALFLADNANLGNFGQSGQLIYIGIAKDSLQDRDFDQHFKSGQTGRSTLRRSLGAILKNKLQLVAIPRGGANDRKRFDHYKFLDTGEHGLTHWMIDNLQIGYWVPEGQITYQELRDKEEKVTIELKPTLDLDRRTRKYNQFADVLSGLRKICKAEANKFSTHL